MSDSVECLKCGQRLRVLTHTHLWKCSQSTVQQYLTEFPGSPLFAADLKTLLTGLKFKGRTYLDIYGPEASSKLIEERTSAAIRQMQDPSQVSVRREAMTGREYSEETLEKMREAKPAMPWNTYRSRALDFYGKSCCRCGFESEEESDFVVHHRDLLNIRTELGNHEVENLEVMCKPCHSKYHDELSGLRGRYVGLPDMERAAHHILKGLRDEFGFDLSDVNLKDTPKRFARAQYEIFSGLFDTGTRVEEILSSAFPSSETSLVISRKIKAFGVCPHHLLPVEYCVDVGYIPAGKVVGLSKMTRLVQTLCARPVLQERATSEIVARLTAGLSSKGAMCVTEARHFCMVMRGVRQDSRVICSSVSGLFESDSALRSEFMGLIK